MHPLLHNGLLFKLKSIGVGAGCCQFERVPLQPLAESRGDAATRERIPIVSEGATRSVLGPLLFILYTSEMFELVENGL